MKVYFKMFYFALLAALMSGEYMTSRECNIRTLAFRNESPLSKCNVVTELNMEDNAIRRWLKQFQDTASVLHPKGAGRSSISYMLTESRKRFLETHKNKLDEFLCS
jgi:transposase-like protein